MRVVDAFLRGFAALMRAVQYLIALLLVASVLLNLSNVVGRYVFHAPISGAEEVMLFLMVGIVFLGAAVVSWEGRHIHMDIVVTLMPQRVQRVLHALSDVAMIVVAGIVVVLAYPVIVELRAYNELSQAANVPLWIPQALIPVGFALIIVATIARMLDTEHRHRPVAAHAVDAAPLFPGET